MRTTFRSWVFAAVGAASLPLTLFVWSGSPARGRGAELFHGGAPLSGRIAGHAEPLPADAVRCRNCHGLESETAARAVSSASSAAPVDAAGPPLGPRLLKRTAKRRGGPPSLYTEQTFCELLRDGVDPARIVIPRLMPRYELGDKECDALWNYLVLR